MIDWLISIEGTRTGGHVALALALAAAFLHALFGALQTGGRDPWLSRAAIDATYGILAAPFALFVVPWPEARMWPIFAGMFVIHAGYKVLQAMTFERGAYTVVYPVVRGAGPLFTVLAASLIFGEVYPPAQWLGVATLVAGILGLAFYNLRSIKRDRRRMASALCFAAATGGFVAAYTTYDAWGIRATANPFTFLAWFFMLDGIFVPLVSWRRWARVPRGDMEPLIKRGVLGAFVAYFSFGAVMLATRLGKVGDAAVLRETSAVFAGLIGRFVLREEVGPARAALMVLIAAGACVMKWGG